MPFYGPSGGGGGAAPVKLNDTSDAIIPVETATSWIVGSDRMHLDSADTTKNIRAFFNKVKGAFRAGRANSDQWDDANVGVNSFAVGENTLASGAQSVAMGSDAQATQTYSIAFGRGATSGAAEAIGLGTQSIAAGVGSVAAGYSCVTTGSNATAMGYFTRAEGFAAFASGERNYASGNFAIGSGSWARAERSTQWAHAGGTFSNNQGEAQTSVMVLMHETTNATPTVLTTGKAAPYAGLPTANVLVLETGRSYHVTIEAAARRLDVQGEMAGYRWIGVVGRDTTGNARIIGTPITNSWADAGAAAWTLAVSVNTTNHYLAVTATGEAGKTIRWVASTRFTEVKA